MRESNSTFVPLGGVGEIGGNKFLIQDHDTRILLDFGVSYADRRRFYSEPLLSPRDEKELFEFGMLPKLEGLYKFEESEPSIQGVFLSHPCSVRPFSLHLIPQPEDTGLLRRDDCDHNSGTI